MRSSLKAALVSRGPHPTLEVFAAVHEALIYDAHTAARPSGSRRPEA
jgi:hypothetical protein